jgi:hypothetical protein
MKIVQAAINRPKICSQISAIFSSDVYEKTLCYVKSEVTSALKQFGRDFLGGSRKAVVSIDGRAGNRCSVFDGSGRTRTDLCQNARHFLCQYNDTCRDSKLKLFYAVIIRSQLTVAPASAEEEMIQNVLNDALKSALTGGSLDEAKAVFGELFADYGVQQATVDSYFDALGDVGSVAKENPTEAEKEIIKQKVTSLGNADKALIESIRGLENIGTNPAFALDPRFAEFNAIRFKSTVGQTIAQNFPQSVLTWLKDPEGIGSFSKSFALALEASRVLSG